MTGALAALQARLQVPVGEFDMMVGTSAGSVLVAALRCGFTVEEMVAHQRGGRAGALGVLGSPDLGYGPLPPWPRPGLGSPRLLLAALRAPCRMHLGVVASACLPPGRADNAGLRARMQGLTAHAARRPGPASTAADWASPDRAWIVAVDYDTGSRVVFGRPGAPPAALPDAVTASCAIPGWFRPAVIAGRRYVDGGVRSATSADLLAEAGLDEVYVLAPTASLVAGRPRTPLERAERAVRRWMTFALRREAARLRSGGVTVTVLTPGPEDLDAIGANLMDPGRRHDVFETSLRTSARSLADAMSGMGAAA
jgi:NTE family protein